MNIAVRVPNWIGDCIMCLPAIGLIKKSIPESRITVVCRENLCDLFINVKEIDAIIPIPAKAGFLDILRTAKKYKNHSFDKGVLFTNSFISALWFKLMAIPAVCGYRRDGRGFLLSKRIPYVKNDRHHALYYLDMVARCLDQPLEDHVEISVKPSEDERKDVAGKLSKMGIDTAGTIVGMAPTAAYGPAKEWPAGRYRQLIDEILSFRNDVHIVLLGSRQEKQGLERIAADGGRKVTVLAGDLNLREAMVAISFCGVFVSNDSGLMHVAAALGIPQVAIFGPTNPRKTSPLNDQAVVLFEPPSCWPCLHRECPKENHFCMERISVVRVFGEVKRILHDG